MSPWKPSARRRWTPAPSMVRRLFHICLILRSLMRVGHKTTFRDSPTSDKPSPPLKKEELLRILHWVLIGGLVAGCMTTSSHEKTVADLNKQHQDELDKLKAQEDQQNKDLSA